MQRNGHNLSGNRPLWSRAKGSLERAFARKLLASFTFP
jgi:hypothetical protein